MAGYVVYFLCLLTPMTSGSYLHIEDMCATNQTIQMSARQGFLQTPTDNNNQYPPNKTCQVSLCTTSHYFLIQLLQFNLQPSKQGACADFIRMGDELQLCGVQSQQLEFPVAVKNGCLFLQFVSNGDRYTGSGAKISFQVLPTDAGVHILCSGGKPSFQQLPPYGYFISKGYPTAILHTDECLTEYSLPPSCTLLRVQFIEFTIHEKNELTIADQTFTGSMTGAQRMLDVSANQTLRVGVRLEHKSARVRQKILLNYACEFGGELRNLAETADKPGVVGTVYISDSVISQSKQTFEIPGTENTQLFVFLLSWWHQTTTDVSPVMYIEDQPLRSANSHITLRTSRARLTIRIEDDSQIPTQHNFILFYHDNIDGVYDICQQEGITPRQAGYIMSQNYPDAYESSLNCQLVLNVLEHSHLQLDILDLETEGLTESGNYHDYLEVVHGGVSRKYQGETTIIRPTVHVNSTARLQFVTDQFTERRGFIIRYTVIDPPPSTLPVTITTATQDTPLSTFPITVTTTTQDTPLSTLPVTVTMVTQDPPSSTLPATVTTATQTSTNETIHNHSTVTPKRVLATKFTLTERARGPAVYITITVAAIVGVVCLFLLIVIIACVKRGRDQRILKMIRDRERYSNMVAFNDSHSVQHFNRQVREDWISDISSTNQRRPPTPDSNRTTASDESAYQPDSCPDIYNSREFVSTSERTSQSSVTSVRELEASVTSAEEGWPPPPTPPPEEKEEPVTFNSLTNNGHNSFLFLRPPLQYPPPPREFSSPPLSAGSLSDIVDNSTISTSSEGLTNL